MKNVLFNAFLLCGWIINGHDNLENSDHFIYQNFFC